MHIWVSEFTKWGIYLGLPPAFLCYSQVPLQCAMSAQFSILFIISPLPSRLTETKIKKLLELLLRVEKVGRHIYWLGYVWLTAHLMEGFANCDTPETWLMQQVLLFLLLCCQNVPTTSHSKMRFFPFARWHLFGEEVCLQFLRVKQIH